ncbi:hypothetical protein FB451DRAFT_1498452 [Mycena latifolia]|nr:hypothetical protein FB451DRAFT_1498452 [Mycena latifolia]
MYADGSQTDVVPHLEGQPVFGVIGGRPSELVPLLPAFYANLDPTRLPSPDIVDAMQVAGNHSNAVLAGMVSLQFIASLPKLPRGIYPELWPRAWGFIAFLHTYSEHLLGLPSKKVLYGTFAKLFVRFQAFGFCELVCSTPGVRVVLATGWNIFLNSDGVELQNVSWFINWDPHDSPTGGHIDEYLEGAGGSLDSLALMVIKHLGHAAATDKVSERGHSHFTAAITFIWTVKDFEKFASNFGVALRRQGVLRALVAGVCSLNGVTADHKNGVYLLTMCFNLLGIHSTHSPGRTWMAEALQSGLLRAIVLVASSQTPDAELDGQLDCFLTKALPPYMVYRSILVHMRACLLEVEDLVKSEAFLASKSFAAWQRFHTVVCERLDLLEIFDSTPGALYKGCDNMACGQLREKSELQRCSICLDVYYCSRQCQAIDWRAGHRLNCPLFSGVRNLPEEQQCSKQDRAYMRALIHRDYLANRPQIFAAEISHMKQNPQELTLVSFDYMNGPVVVDISPWPTHTTLVEVAAMPYDWVARHHNHGYRAAASAGRLTVHMMKIPNGMKYHLKIFPLRHTGQPGREIRNYLWAIAQKVAHLDITDPTYESIVHEELKPLLAMDLPCIHE